MKALILASVLLLQTATMRADPVSYRVTTASSASVFVKEPVLTLADGHAAIAGVVRKIYEAKTTENTHLDLRFLGTSGQLIEERSILFSPRRLTTERHSPNRQGHYAASLDPMPVGTAGIEVRAHDTPHPSSHISQP